MSDNKVTIRDSSNWYYKKACRLMGKKKGLDLTNYIKSLIDADLSKHKVTDSEVLSFVLKSEKRRLKATA